MYPATICPKTGPHIINTFENMEEVLEEARQIPVPIVIHPTSKEERVKVTQNETKMIQDWLRINSAGFQLAKGYGWKIQNRYTSFVQLCKEHAQRKEEFEKVEALVKTVLSWIGFQLGSTPRALSLEGLIEYLDRGATTVDHVLAWEWAKYDSGQRKEIPSPLEDPLKYVYGFKYQLEFLSRSRAFLEKDQQSMPIGSAFQEFRRQIMKETPVISFLTNEPVAEFEALFAQELETARPLLSQVKDALRQFRDIPTLYWTLKETNDPIAFVADDLRRRLSISTLYTLVRMIQNKLISKECYLKHHEQLQEMLSTLKEMDRCNLEIKILGDLTTHQPKAGAFSGDDIPSHYPFFEQLDRELMQPSEEAKTA